jgi:hypothetical protein
MGRFKASFKAATVARVAKREFTAAAATASLVIALLLASIAAIALALASWKNNDSDDNDAAPSNVINSKTSCDGTDWWSKEYQYFHLESYVLVVLVWMAMILDTLSHQLSRTSQVNGGPPGSIWNVLSTRCGGELMVLGLLTLIVYICKKVDAFDRLADALKDYRDVRMPANGVDYLHVVEEAHMQLFVSLFVYIFILTLMAIGTARAERQWEAANLASMRFYQTGQWTPAVAPAVSDYEREFTIWRHQFLASLQDRRAHWQDLDQLFQSRLPLLSQKATMSPPRPTRQGTFIAKLDPNDKDDFEPHDDSLNGLLESWFPFQTYLELQSRLLMEHLAEIKATTWLALGLLQLIRAQLLRESRKPWIARMPEVITGVMAVVFFFISVWRFGTPNPAGHKQSPCFICVFGLEPWLTTIHLLQLILCGVCFNIARNGMSEQYWQEDSEGTLLGIILGALCLLALGGFLGVIFPRLTMMVAKSEFMRPMHLRWLCAILDDHIFGRDLNMAQMALSCPPPVGPAPTQPDSLQWDIASRRLQSWATTQDFSKPEEISAPKSKGISTPASYSCDFVERLVPERSREEEQQPKIPTPSERSRSDSEHSITFCSPEARKIAWAELD